MQRVLRFGGLTTYDPGSCQGGDYQKLLQDIQAGLPKFIKEERSSRRSFLSSSVNFSSVFWYVLELEEGVSYMALARVYRSLDL